MDCQVQKENLDQKDLLDSQGLLENLEHLVYQDYLD